MFMKKFTMLMSLMLMAAVVFGQSLMEKRTRHFVKTKGDVEQNRDLTIIWEDDFSDADIWLAEYDEENPNDGPWVVGTDGPSGFYSGGMGPIESTTADNGFAMYDSDAVGVSETSQDSKLVYDGTIDCTDYDGVAVSFESYYRAFHGACYIEVSIDGTTWEQFEIHPEIEVTSATANPELVTVNISDIAANEANVYFRFRYIGEWDYAWMVDDLKFIEAPDNDLKIVNSRVNFWPEYINYGYSGFFGKVPQRQITSADAYIFFSGIVKNIGTIDATPTMSITVTDPSSTEIYTNSVTYDTVMTTEQMDTLIIDDPMLFLTDAEMGLYTWTFETFEDGVTEENPTDNTVVWETEITENIYAHDRGMVTGSWSTDNYTNGGLDGDVVGVEYQFFNEDTITGGKVYISSMTEVGTSFVFKVYNWDINNDTWEEGISSEIISIDDESDVGKMHEISFDDPFIIQPLEGYSKVLAAVEYYPANKTFRVGVDNTVPTNGFETWMYFMNDLDWFYYGGDHVPVIQLVLISSENAVANNVFTNFEVYPNPTTGMVQLENVKDAKIEIYNMLGMLVETVNNADFSTSIDLSNFAEGTYVVRVTAEQGVGTRKINLVK